MPATITLVRHGETAWSLTGQHTGLTDMPLTAEGERKARSLQDRFKRITFDRVFTSPLLRARRTCDLAGFGEAAKVDPDLVEWDYGDYEGRTSKEILAARPGRRLFAMDARTASTQPTWPCAPIASSPVFGRRTTMRSYFQAATS